MVDLEIERGPAFIVSFISAYCVFVEFDYNDPSAEYMPTATTTFPNCPTNK